jgi:hypothetical protein
VTEDKGEVVVAGGIGQPVPGKDALTSNEESLAEGVGRGGQFATRADLAVVVEDDEEEGLGMQIDAGIESGVSGRLEGTHDECLR